MEHSELLQSLRIERSQREEHRQRHSRWPLVAAGLVVLVAAASSAWWYIHRPLPVQTAPAIAPATQRVTDAVLQATGYVTARRQATVSAQITGTLTAVLIEEGDHVRKGQIVARLDDSQYRAALDAARTQASAAHALAAQYAAQLSQDQRDAQRQETLAAQGLAARQTAEQARTLVDTTRAQWLAQQHTAASADAQVVEAQVNFDYCVVHAPFDGVITTKDAQVGEIISPFSTGGFTRTGVGTIVDMDSLEVDVDVNEAYIGRVQPAMTAEAVLDAYPDWRIPAHVIAIVPAADRGKATVKVRVALEQKDGRLVPDMGVRVSFLEQKSTPHIALPPGVLVPSGAVVDRGGRQVVFVVEAGIAHERTVQPQASTDASLQRIPAALSAGETVVSAPPNALHDGMRVAVAPSAAP